MIIAGTGQSIHEFIQKLKDLDYQDTALFNGVEFTFYCGSTLDDMYDKYQMAKELKRLRGW